MKDEIILRIRELNKSFPGVRALDNINLDVKKGEVHALLGENGAGKSTLVKIISGAYRKDSGEIYFDGIKRDFASTSEAYKNGISIIYQETSLVHTLNVLQNIFLGMEYSRTFLNIIDNKKIIKEYYDVCDNVGFSFPINKIVKDLGVAEQKMVEILKAMVRRARFIIMDEPTDSLSESEINQLFKIISKLKKNNITVLYITHILEEVFRITDRITVLRDGKKIDTVLTENVNEKDIISMMVGHEVEDNLSITSKKKGERREALRVKDISKKGVISNISFTAYSGEVLGITGLIGAGKTELARLLFGADRIDRGSIYVNKNFCKIKSPIDAINNKICMLPEDRKESGLILKHDVCKNITLSALNNFINKMIILKSKELKVTNEMVKKLDIKISSVYQIISDLSGGNQQKVVIGKWLTAKPEILILDEPTRGIDVNTKYEVHKIIRELAENGVCIILMSSEVHEIVKVCDRILILKKGTITTEFLHGVSQKEIMHTILEEGKISGK